MPHERNGERESQHDDARRDALGRGALQQRRLSDQGYELRRELQRERRAAKPDPNSATNRRTKKTERHPVVSRSAAALGNLAAGKHPARVRARWKTPSGN